MRLEIHPTTWTSLWRREQQQHPWSMTWEKPQVFSCHHELFHNNSWDTGLSNFQTLVRLIQRFLSNQHVPWTSVIGKSVTPLPVLTTNVMQQTFQVAMRPATATTIGLAMMVIQLSICKVTSSSNAGTGHPPTYNQERSSCWWEATQHQPRVYSSNHHNHSQADGIVRVVTTTPREYKHPTTKIYLVPRVIVNNTPSLWSCQYVHA